jgi:hypothetical protein
MKTLFRQRKKGSLEERKLALTSQIEQLNKELDSKDDLPPENESSFMLDWKIRKGATDGQKILHTGADSQQAA